MLLRSRLRWLCAASLGSLSLSSCGAEPSASPQTGEDLFRTSLCGSCHGSAGKGTWMGPDLTGLSEHWERESLAEFLRDPARRVASDERLAELSRKFPTPMVVNRVLDKPSRLRLADWLLGVPSDQKP